MLPSEVAKKSIKDLNFDMLVANMGFENEAVIAKKELKRLSKKSPRGR